ncbi:endoplasmic oxidoreductin-1 [Lecanora helva]
MRRPAAKGFYLAVFSLFGYVHTKPTNTASSHASSAEVCAVRHHDGAVKSQSANVHKIEPTAIVSDACASYSTLDTLNNALAPSLKSITQDTDFFAYYRLNLYDQQCPVKALDDETGTCGNIACKVDTLEDEKDIPIIWRAEELSKLEGPKAAHPGKRLQEERGSQRPLQGTLGENVGESCVVEYDDECDERDYCVPEDESATVKGDYVSLVDNPERFTGYAGSIVWDSIYRENCFSKASRVDKSRANSGSSNLFQAANDLRTVIQRNTPSSELELDDECLEKRVFHRIISGMHASISTHICFDYLNQTTGTWGPNLQCYQDRLVSHPERISNLYFDYAILLRAVTKLRTHLKNYTFCSGDISQDMATKSKILHLADTAASYPPIFDENTMFQDPDVSSGLKEDFRNRFRNVSRLMDCVGCDKCRLWGKLQTVGYGTALKVLFEYDELKNGENPPLRRTELVALVNTLDRVSNSLTALNKMRDMVTQQSTIPSAKAPSASAKNFGLPDGSEQKPPSRYKDRPDAQPAIRPDFSDIDDIDDSDEDISSNDESIYDSLTSEFNLVFRTLGYVLKSWLEFPGKALKILIFELSRLWSFWLGLPVYERSWEWRWSAGRVDEL